MERRQNSSTTVIYYKREIIKYYISYLHVFRSKILTRYKKYEQTASDVKNWNLKYEY